MIRKILVPLDGSRNSYRGLDEAISLVKQCTRWIRSGKMASIIGIYVKDVPGVYGFYPIGFVGQAISKWEAKRIGISGLWRWIHATPATVNVSKNLVIITRKKLLLRKKFPSTLIGSNIGWGREHSPAKQLEAY